MNGTLHTINGRPVNADSVATKKDPTPPAPTQTGAKQTHRPECGEVGETGEHGDLGSNAAE